METSSLESNPKAEMRQTHLSYRSVDRMGKEQATVSEKAAEDGVQSVKMGPHCHTEGHMLQFQQEGALVSSGKLFSRPQFPSV